ncbi:MAG: hypothetical protein HN413_14315 [Chloroflexi bacterium]|jgi:hypothetical protein|nr:hypothetical protein [Chloroflexota bacterium]
MSGITKTIPQKDGIEAVEALYAGASGEFEFHMAGKPSRLNIGDYVYTIWQDMVVGRCQVTRIEHGAVNPDSGKPRSLIFVKTPGEKLEKAYSRKGHRGTRYYDGEGWGK